MLSELQNVVFLVSEDDKARMTGNSLPPSPGLSLGAFVSIVSLFIYWI